MEAVWAARELVSPFAYSLLMAQEAQAMRYNVELMAQVHGADATYRVKRADSKQQKVVALDSDGMPTADTYAIDEEFGLQEYDPAGGRVTSVNSCSCQFFTSFGLPCRHLMRLHLQLNMNTFDPYLISKKWLRVGDAERMAAMTELIAMPKPIRAVASTSAAAPPVRTRGERYALALTECTAIMDMMSLSEQKYQVGQGMLKAVATRLRMTEKEAATSAAAGGASATATAMALPGQTAAAALPAPNMSTAGLEGAVAIVPGPSAVTRLTPR